MAKSADVRCRDMEKRMRAARRLDCLLISNNLSGREEGQGWGEIKGMGVVVGNLRLPHIRLPIPQVRTQPLHRQPLTARLRAHKLKHGLKHRIREDFVTRAHLFPQIIHHPLHGDGAIGEDVAAAEGHEAFVVGAAGLEGEVLELVYEGSVSSAETKRI